MTNIPTIQLECKKDGLQQLQNGTWKLSLTVNGDDMERAIGTLGKAPMGTIYMVAMAEVGDDGQPRDRAKEEDAKKPKDITESQRCAMLCKQARFQDWLQERDTVLWDYSDQGGELTAEETATAVVKQLCHISYRESRRVLDSDPEGEPSKRWLQLKSQFEQDTGLTAEKRR